jgi:hypothetical protein
VSGYPTRVQPFQQGLALMPDTSKGLAQRRAARLASLADGRANWTQSRRDALPYFDMSTPPAPKAAAATAADKLGSAREAITYFRPMEEREADHAPLSALLIRRMFTYTRRYGARRNWLFVLTFARGLQLPALAWMIGQTINGPIAGRNLPSIYLHAGIYLFLVLTMVVTLHFRQRFALELGEAVAHDMRLELFRKLTTLPMSFFNKTKFGRIISRMTSDIDSVRVAVQDVAFVVTIQAVQMTVAAAADGVVQLEALLADAAVGAGDMAGQPELPAGGEPPVAKGAGNLEPVDLDAGRISGRHPGHPGVCAAGDQRRVLPQAGEPARRKQRGRGASLGGVHSAAPDEEPAFPGRSGAAQRLRRAALARLAAHGGGRSGDVLLPGQLLLRPRPGHRQPV